MNSEDFFFVTTMLFVGVSAILSVFLIGTYDNNVILSNSTAHDICYHLTNNSAVQASADNGRLVCSEPSYDHTQNIIIRDNGDVEE